MQVKIWLVLVVVAAMLIGAYAEEDDVPCYREQKGLFKEPCTECCTRIGKEFGSSFLGVCMCKQTDTNHGTPTEEHVGETAEN